MPQDGFYDAVRTSFTKAVPHIGECGMTIPYVAADGAEVELPYRREWLGDTERGLLHTGIITTVVDSASGLAVLAALGEFAPIATLDLRMDYLRPALPERTLHCRAECYRLTRQIAFVRAWVWQDERDAPIAVSHSAFMCHGRSQRFLDQQ